MPLGKALVLSTLSLRICPNVAFETVPMFVSVNDDGPLSSFQGRSPSASSFNASLLQAIDGVTSLALCPQVVSVSIFSTLQIFRGEASCLWGLLCQPVYLLGRFPSLRHVQGSTPTGGFEGGCLPSDAFHSEPPILFFTFCSKLIESVRIMACMVWLSPLEAIQRKAWVTASTSIVKLEVETV